MWCHIHAWLRAKSPLHNGPACLKVVFRCYDLQKRVYLFLIVYFHASYSTVESNENNEDENLKAFAVAAQQRRAIKK